MKIPKFEIIVGTYEEYLLGFHFVSKQTELVQSFAIHGHSSSIRCVASSDHYLASGAADDKIIVYDLKLRKEHCLLNHHNATVNCLQFTNNHSHLISGSSDGKLSIIRAGSWQLEKSWGLAHKGSAILDVAVHSSGKLALTIGGDCSLRTWNLVKGRQAYVINLNSKSNDARSLEKIIWAKDGVRFILSGGKYTEIWSIETGGIVKVIEHDEKVCSCIWISENQILVGYETGEMALIEIIEGTKNIQKAHDGRVKALAKYSKWIVSASSTGEIKVWNSKLEELSKHETGCRITCLTITTSTVEIKEEKDIEVVEEKISEKTVKKSTVIVEVEDSENESNAEVKTKEKMKKTNTFIEQNEEFSKTKMQGKRKAKDRSIKVGNVKQKKQKKTMIDEDSHDTIKEGTDVLSENQDIYSVKKNVQKKRKQNT